MCRLNKKNNGRRMDKCIKPLIKWLKNSGYDVVSSCCGHGKYPMSIIAELNDEFFELLTDTDIPRQKRFYKKDKEGYFFIPEVIEELEHENK